MTGCGHERRRAGRRRPSPAMRIARARRAKRSGSSGFSREQRCFRKGEQSRHLRRGAIRSVICHFESQHGFVRQGDRQQFYSSWHDPLACVTGDRRWRSRHRERLRRGVADDGFHGDVGRLRRRSLGRMFRDVGGFAYRLREPVENPARDFAAGDEMTKVEPRRGQERCIGQEQDARAGAVTELGVEVYGRVTGRQNRRQSAHGAAAFAMDRLG